MLIGVHLRSSAAHKKLPPGGGNALFQRCGLEALKVLALSTLAVLFALCVVTVWAWLCVSKPVLLEIGTETTILNPVRSRAPARIADVFLRASSRAACSPDVSEALCKFVTRRPLPATEWRLVYRRDSAQGITLYYRLRGNWDQQPRSDKCLIARVILQRNAAGWNTVGYGVQPGPCNGRE